MRKVGIVGGLGNMGQRYATILKSMGIKPLIIDEKIPDSFSLLCSAEGLIIATPTKSHEQDCIDCFVYGVPIMCEKPLIKDSERVKNLMAIANSSKVNLTCVGQYRHLVGKSNEKNNTIYNYYKHGNDGLIWDCYQIIGLAEGLVTLQEDSAKWHCIINGNPIKLEKMDDAYIQEIRCFVEQKNTLASNEVILWHEKAERMSAHARHCISWDSGT